MSSRTVLILIVVLAVAAFVLRRLIPPASVLAVERADVHFPTVSGSNLQREAFTFPRDLAGELNIVFVPFLERQQTIVNSWVPFAQETEATFPALAYYELPTIDGGSALFRMFLNEGMRAGIPDQTARERTVTLYIDTAEFMAATDINGKQEMHTLLVNRDGDILWRTTGFFDDEKGQSLLAVIQANR